ncbi:MAG: hypothetical protein R2849_08570 [Thermomicrobiales bacterium]
MFRRQDAEGRTPALNDVALYVDTAEELVFLVEKVANAGMRSPPPEGRNVIFFPIRTMRRCSIIVGQPGDAG